MPWLKWVSLFCAVYGILWLRSHVLQDNIGQATELRGSVQKSTELLLHESKTENPRAEKSLSYALQKMASPERNISRENFSDTTIASFNLPALARLKDRPFELLLEAEKQLEHLSREQLRERNLVLREIVSVRNAETMHNIEVLLEQERMWFGYESSQITDADALSSYISELTRLSLMADAGKSKPLEMLQQLSAPIVRNPQALEALSRSIRNYIPWEYRPWIQQLPPEISEKLGTP